MLVALLRVLSAKCCGGKVVFAIAMWAFLVLTVVSTAPCIGNSPNASPQTLCERIRSVKWAPAETISDAETKLDYCQNEVRFSYGIAYKLKCFKKGDDVVVSCTYKLFGSRRIGTTIDASGSSGKQIVGANFIRQCGSSRGAYIEPLGVVDLED